MTQGRRLSIAQIAAVTAAALTCTPALAQTNASWVGPTSGVYNDAANWNPADVPLNNGTTFNAIIPSGNTVTYDIDGVNAVSGLSLSSGSTLLLRRPGGNPFASVDFTVTTQAFLDGMIDADGTDFTANGTQLNGDQTRVMAAGGASVTIDASGAYSTEGLTGGGTILSAGGTGSMVDLSSVESINAGFNDNSSTVRIQIIEANNNGGVNLSSLTQVSTPARTEDRIEFLSNGGTIDLSSLEVVIGSGQARFTVNSGGSIDVGPIQQANRMTVSLTNPGSSLSIGGFAGVAQVNDSTVSVSGGAYFDGATLRAAWATEGFTGGGTILSAGGTGSLLDLSSVESINAGFNDNSSTVRTQIIRASDDGVINLSAVTQVTAPDRIEDRLDFEADNASINLAALENIGGVGDTRFMISNGGSMTLGPLTSTQNVVIDMDSSGRVDAPGDLNLGLGVMVQIQVSPLSASRFDVVGEASLGGDLEIELIGGLAQRILRSFDLIVADEIVGEFGDISGNLLTISNEQALVPVLVRGDGNDPDILKLVATAPGDANLDLKVDAADLNALALNWQKDVDAWQEADFNDDQVVDAADLNLLAINWQVGVFPGPGGTQPSLVSFETAWAQALANASIPEPVSGLVWVMGVATVTVMSQRRSRMGQ